MFSLHGKWVTKNNILLNGKFHSLRWILHFVQNDTLRVFTAYHTV